MSGATDEQVVRQIDGKHSLTFGPENQPLLDRGQQCAPLATSLLDLYGGVFDQYLRYQMVAVVFRGEIAAREHKALLDCALTRNADKACEVLTQHVNGCVAYTLKRGALK